MSRARALRQALWLAGLLGLGGAAGATTCSVSTTPLAFGAYASPGGANVDSSASVLVTCTPSYLLLACTASYTLSLSAGSTGSPGARQMAAGSGRLAYGLFSDAARTTPWGDGGAGGAAVGGTITTSLLSLVCLAGSRSHTIHGRIPGLQSVPAGVYADEVVLTVTY